MSALPFKLNTHLSTVSGLLRLQDDGIAVEYMVSDGILNLFKSDLHQQVIPLNSLRSIALRRSIFTGTRVDLEFNSMQYVESLHGADGPCWSISIERRHLDDALDFVRRVQLEQADEQLRQADSSLS